MEIRELLEKVQNHQIDLSQAEAELAKLPYEDLHYAKLDHHRALRRGTGEVIFCQNKDKEHLVHIYESFQRSGVNVLGTRASQEQADAVMKSVPLAKYDPLSKILTIHQQPITPTGCIAVCSGGTADVPVAEEAAQTAEFLGSRVQRYYDVGVAGIHRLFANIEEIRQANSIIAVAGMEGALAGVVAGMVSKPVIAVPTSVGYGASFHGLSALLTMLNSCAEGISVVNIDNGFGAGYQAHQINRLVSGNGKDSGEGMA